MNLTKLYKMQRELDNHILKNNNVKMSKEERLDNTILAMLVEVGELANTTRCFKYWSVKGMMEKEVVLDELADVWHFYLSIGNQIGAKFVYHKEWQFDMYETTTDLFNQIISSTSNFHTVNKYKINGAKDNYGFIGLIIKELWENLGFTNEEVEQAYLKKHKENYKRQEGGY